MIRKTAMAIFKDIYNGITKDDLLEVLRWLVEEYI